MAVRRLRAREGAFPLLLVVKHELTDEFLQLFVLLPQLLHFGGRRVCILRLLPEPRANFFLCDEVGLRRIWDAHALVLDTGDDLRPLLGADVGSHTSWNGTAL